ncbi:hypothetical protein CLV76_1448 [Marivita geojedonensis]|nr:hypothetical protein CLV76_1448 [Marivita geojedonensis]
MLLGPIGNLVVLVTISAWVFFLTLSAKKLTDISWPGALLVGAVFGLMLGLPVALITDSLPHSYGSSGNTESGEPVHRDR